MAPDWSSPTEGNGDGVPPAILHVALVAPNRQAAELYARYARVISPPLWKGKVELHVVTMAPGTDIDLNIGMALVDLGLIDSKDIGMIGYPSGVPDDRTP